MMDTAIRTAARIDRLVSPLNNIRRNAYAGGAIGAGTAIFLSGRDPSSGDTPFTSGIKGGAIGAVSGSLSLAIGARLTHRWVASPIVMRAIRSEVQQIPAELPRELVPVRDETLDLAQANLARLRGVPDDDRPRGFADLAELGTIQSNVAFLRMAAGA